MRGRDVQSILNNKGFDKGVTYILINLIEMQNQQAKDLKELASYFDKMVESLNGVISVAEQMKSAVDTLKSEEPEVI